MNPLDREKRDKSDTQFLIAQPQFLRFMWRVIQTSRILSRTTDGSTGRELAFDEGVRSLALEILEMVEAGQHVPHPDGLPIMTLIQTFHEEANQPAQEKPSGKDRYSRNSELDDSVDDQADSA